MKAKVSRTLLVPGAGRRQGIPSSCHAFTLIELMAVVLLIALLAVLAINILGYIQTTLAVRLARSQIAVMETALENYKSDWGYYPATTPIHFSDLKYGESVNSYLLYRALTGQNGRKQYLQLAPNLCKSNSASGLINIVDPWGTPYNYYNSPKTAYARVNGAANSTDGCVLGGQVNKNSYDLFSYGQNRSTYVAGADTFNGWFYGSWGLLLNASDDIGNCTK